MISAQCKWDRACNRQSFCHCRDCLRRCVNILRCDFCVATINQPIRCGHGVRRRVSGSKLASCGRMDCKRLVALRNASGPNLVPRRLECVQSLGMPTTPTWSAPTLATSHKGPSNSRNPGCDKGGWNVVIVAVMLVHFPLRLGGPGDQF